MHLQTVTTATAAEVDAQVEPKPEPREQRGSHLFSGGLGLRAGSKRWGKPCRPGVKGCRCLSGLLHFMSGDIGKFASPWRGDATVAPLPSNTARLMFAQGRSARPVLSHHVEHSLLPGSQGSPQCLVSTLPLASHPCQACLYARRWRTDARVPGIVPSTACTPAQPPAQPKLAACWWCSLSCAADHLATSSAHRWKLSCIASTSAKPDLPAVASALLTQKSLYAGGRAFAVASQQCWMMMKAPALPYGPT